MDKTHKAEYLSSHQIASDGVNPYVMAYKFPRMSNRDKTVSVRTDPKIGRNERCPCGSGKKYKKCCKEQ